MLDRWRAWAGNLKRQTVALYLAARDPRTPWYAKALGVCLVAYAASPIDLVPDFIPVLGYLDDLILLPLGIALMVRLVPPAVWAECLGRAREIEGRPGGGGRVAAVVIGLLWLAVLAASTSLEVRHLGSR